MYKSIALLFCLLGSCIATLGASAPPPDAIQRELAQANVTLQLATFRKDVATVRRLITDDYVIYFGNGTSENHDAMLADVGDPATQWQKNDTENLAVRHYNNDTAIVTAALHQRYVYKGKIYDYRVRFTDVWVKIDGVWRYASAHASTANSTPGYPKTL